MADVSDAIQAFLDSLQNPRFGTDAPHAEAPIELDGVWNGQHVTFFASPNDIMPYGVEAYHRALSGGYGPIGPYQIPAALAQAQASEAVSLSTANVLHAIGLGDPARTATLGIAATTLMRQGGKIPADGPDRAKLEKVAALWRVKLEALPQFITAVEDLQFAMVELTARFRAAIAEATGDHLRGIVDAFNSEFKALVTDYNKASPPTPLAMPPPIALPGS